MGDEVTLHPMLALVALVVTLLLVPVVKLINGWWSTRAAEQSAEAAKQSAAAAEQSARTADWEAYTKEIKDWTTDRLRERDEKIAALVAEVESLKSSLASFRRKYLSAIRYITYLVAALRAHVPADQITPPPSDISEDLDERATHD